MDAIPAIVERALAVAEQESELMAEAVGVARGRHIENMRGALEAAGAGVALLGLMAAQPKPEPEPEPPPRGIPQE